MNKLEEVLNDFYCCLSIPIHFVSKSFEILYRKEYCLDTYNLLANTTFYNDIKENSSPVFTLTYFNNIHFVVMPISNMQSYNGYFIVGPFKSENTHTEIEMPFKPFYCIDCISYTLKNIVKENLSKDNSLSEYVKSSIDYIHRNYYKDIKIDDICKHLSINKSYFCSIFKKETGYTFTNFFNKLRVEKSKQLLGDRKYSILDVALSVGYNNHNYYTTTFKKFNGDTPLEYRNNILKI